MSQILEDKLDKLSPEERQLWTLRHTAEHILHQAVKEMYPSIHLAMGPATSEGFYFDFDSKPEGKPVVQLSEEDFSKIEKEMQRLVNKNLPLIRQEITPDEATALFADNPYKLEWINAIRKRGEKVTVYWTGNPNEKGSMVDLCGGPHVDSTGKVKAFKLLSIAGAYWHGDEKNKMLTRIYGTAFASQKELDDHLHQLEEIKKRDHRKLGRDLDLFSTSPLVGPGLVLWHPKLSRVRNIVEEYWKKKHYENGYELVHTPHIGSMDMFVISRHYSKYANAMFPAMIHHYIQGESRPDYTTDEQLKPMNCPGHIQIYKHTQRSYRELPLRLGELGTVYRYERAGVLHGMTRVRGFTQDDSHLFCRPDQVIDEVQGILRLTKEMYTLFGFSDFKAYLATRPEKYLGKLETWEFAENSLKEALEHEKIAYTLDAGEGAFYGPKIDLKIKDSLGREWQLGTIQFDFNMPDRAETTDEEIDEFWQYKIFKEKFSTREKLATYLKKLGRGFDVTYIDTDGQEKRAIMIHRTVLGSMERFFGILIEHYGGQFPLWLAPVQMTLVPIADRHGEYAEKIASKLKIGGLRVEVDNRSISMQAKIRDITLQKVPFIGIMGDKEIESGVIAVRTKEGENKGTMTIDSFLQTVQAQIEKETNKI